MQVDEIGVRHADKLLSDAERGQAADVHTKQASRRKSRQDEQAVKPLRLAAQRVRRGDDGIGRGDGIAQIDPTGLEQIGFVLHLIGQTGQRAPTEPDGAVRFRQ